MLNKLRTWLRPRSQLIRRRDSEFLGGLPSMLAEHGFVHAGFTESEDHMYGSEDHYFFSSRCTLVFGFPYSTLYGENYFAIGDPSSSHEDVRSLVLLSFYIPDYHEAFFAYRRKADSDERDYSKKSGDALVVSISTKLEEAIRLFLHVRAQGRLIPLKRDWAAMAAVKK